MSREEKDRRNKRTGIYVSAGAHIAVILLFIFLAAWRAPDPPLPEFGIELNFGTSDQGTGDVQPETVPAEAESEEEALPDASQEVPEETVEEAIETPVEETTETVEEEIIPVTEQETEAPVIEPEKKVEEVKPKVVEVVVEEKKEDPKPPKVLYPGNKEGASGTTGEAKNAADANQGDKIDAQGDQGDKDGTVDARALMGTQGGGGGGMLEMAGWKWDNEPDPKETTNESGKIVFEIIIDERGEVISANSLSRTVSASLVRIYQAEVMRLTFSKISSGQAALRTEGTITFTIKSK